MSRSLAAASLLGLVAVLVVVAASWLAACAPEVGSPEWCEAMKEKARGDWTANEALDFARNCVL